MRRLNYLTLSLFLLFSSALKSKPILWEKGSYVINNFNSKNKREFSSYKDLSRKLTKKIRLVNHANIPSPILEGKKLQATDLSFNLLRRRLITSYTFSGAAKKGALQLSKIHTRGKASIRSEIIFKNSDINAVHVEHGRVYFAGSDPKGSFFSYVKIKDDSFTELTAKIYLPGYVATDILVNHKKIFITTANKGGVFSFTEDKADYNWFYKIPYARSLALNRFKREVHVISGAPAKIYRLSKKGQLISVLNMEGAETPSSKSNIIINGRYSYATVGERGMHILCKNKVIKTIESPSFIERPHIRPVINSTAISGDLIFTANGAAGFSIFKKESKEILDRIRCKAPKIIKKAHVYFPRGASANYVTTKANYIFIASGKAGVRIYKKK